MLNLTACKLDFHTLLNRPSPYKRNRTQSKCFTLLFISKVHFYLLSHFHISTHHQQMQPFSYTLYSKKLNHKNPMQHLFCLLLNTKQYLIIRAFHQAEKRIDFATIFLGKIRFQSDSPYLCLLWLNF